MKKIMTFAACLLLAAVTHGAAVAWTLAGATEYKNGGYDIFVIGVNGVTSQAQITDLLKKNGVDSLSSYALGSGTVSSTGSANVSVANTKASITYSGSGTDTYQGFAVIWDAEKENASWSSLATISLVNDSTGKTFSFGKQTTNLANNNIKLGGDTPEPTPEPTSGLLLLVGGALLALRRKQK